MLEFTDLIQNVAFPILITFLLLKMLNEEKSTNKITTEGFIKAIDNNTAAIERIVDVVEEMEQTKLDRGEILKNENK